MITMLFLPAFGYRLVTVLFCGYVFKLVSLVLGLDAYDLYLVHLALDASESLLYGEDPCYLTDDGEAGNLV
jgi:hypothetical protein